VGVNKEDFNTITQKVSEKWLKANIKRELPTERVHGKFYRGAFDTAKNHKRQSVTAKREKSQTPKFV